MPHTCDSYCGLYCGSCSIFMRTRSGVSDSFIDCCPTLPEGELACTGCKSDLVYTPCRMCTIRECAISRGVVHCGECPEHPCKIYRRWQKASLLVPHVSEATANLYDLKVLGSERWREMQEKRWSCDECKTAFSWYTKTCRNCGASLTKRSYPLSTFRKAILRFVLKKAYFNSKNSKSPAK